VAGAKGWDMGISVLLAELAPARNASTDPTMVHGREYRGVMWVGQEKWCETSAEDLPSLTPAVRTVPLPRHLCSNSFGFLSIIRIQ
jgi:hypothetical protein